MTSHYSITNCGKGFLGIWFVIAHAIPIGFHFDNPCVQYSPVLNWISGGIFIAMATVVCFLNLFHVFKTAFCNQIKLHHHYAVQVSFYFAQGSMLLWYDYYTYELNFWPVVAGLFQMYICIILAFRVFFERHALNCPESYTNIEGKKKYKESYLWISTGLIVALSIWIILIICFFSLVTWFDSYLNNTSRPINCVQFN
jgi:uncharacterized membrane protein